jgi:hypothetical protein
MATVEELREDASVKKAEYGLAVNHANSLPDVTIENAGEKLLANSKALLLYGQWRETEKKLLLAQLRELKDKAANSVCDLDVEQRQKCSMYGLQVEMEELLAEHGEKE